MGGRVKVLTMARRRKRVSRPDGGMSHFSDRDLLCGPGNRLKTSAFALSGLRRENRSGHGPETAYPPVSLVFLNSIHMHIYQYRHTHIRPMRGMLGMVRFLIRVVISRQSCRPLQLYALNH